MDQGDSYSLIWTMYEVCVLSTLAFSVMGNLSKLIAVSGLLYNGSENLDSIHIHCKQLASSLLVNEKLTPVLKSSLV